MLNTCRTSLYFTSFRAKTLQYQGIFSICPCFYIKKASYPKGLHLNNQSLLFYTSVTIRKENSIFSLLVTKFICSIGYTYTQSIFYQILEVSKVSFHVGFETSFIFCSSGCGQSLKVQCTSMTHLELVRKLSNFSYCWSINAQNMKQFGLKGYFRESYKETVSCQLIHKKFSFYFHGETYI